MRKIKFILGCVTSVIKKNIFKSENVAISQECEKTLESISFGNKFNKKNRDAEYLANYITTTRWQTI